MVRSQWGPANLISIASILKALNLINTWPIGNSTLWCPSLDKGFNCNFYYFTIYRLLLLLPCHLWSRGGAGSIKILHLSHLFSNTLSVPSSTLWDFHVLYPLFRFPFCLLLLSAFFLYGLISFTFSHLWNTSPEFFHPAYAHQSPSMNE